MYHVTTTLYTGHSGQRREIKRERERQRETERDKDRDRDRERKSAFCCFSDFSFVNVKTNIKFNRVVPRKEGCSSQ